MSALTPAPNFGAAIGIDHIGIVGADLEALAQTFSGLGFNLTPHALHASGRTANRCAMLRGSNYLELMATVPGKTSATLDRFLAHGAGAHILALEVDDEAAALERLRRAGITAHIEATEREFGPASRQSSVRADCVARSTGGPDVADPAFDPRSALAA